METKMAINQQMNKQIATYPYNGHLLNNKKQSSPDPHCKIDIQSISLVKWSEIRQTQKTAYCLMPFIWHSRKCQSMLTDNRLWLQGSGGRVGGVYKGYERTFRHDGTAPHLDWGVVILLCAFVKTYQPTHFKRMNSIMYKLYLNKYGQQQSPYPQRIPRLERDPW